MTGGEGIAFLLGALAGVVLPWLVRALVVVWSRRPSVMPERLTARARRAWGVSEIARKGTVSDGE